MGGGTEDCDATMTMRTQMFQTFLFLLAFALLLSFATCFTTSNVGFQNSRKSLIAQRLVASSRTSDTSLDDFFTEELCANLAEEVQKRVALPFVPEPIVLFVLTQAIQNLSSDLNPETLQRVQELLEAETTESKFDDLPEQERDALADQVAAELNAKIDVPMFDEEQELEVLKQIMRVVLQIITTTDGEARKAMVQTQLQVSRDILGSDESRAQLVKAINAAVDIPILGESEEEAILTTAVGLCADTLQALLPPDLIETLKGESPEGLVRMKEYLILTVNEKVDLVGLSEEQEKVLIESMIEILIDTYVDDTEAEFLLLTKEEQQSLLEERAALLEREMELSTRRYEREQQNLAAKYERIQLRLSNYTGKKIKTFKKSTATSPKNGTKRRSRLVTILRLGM